MSTEQAPEVATESVDSSSQSGGDGRVDNREFRRSRHRECYCRGRNKNCPKCQGTGQLLPNWRENLNAARQSSRPASGPVGEAPSAVGEAPAPAAPRERESYQPRDNGGYQQRDNGGYSNNDRGGGRNDRQQRWQDRRNDRSGGRNSNGRNNGGNQQNKGKVCPMCGEFVPNLRQHVLAKHDD